MAQQNKDPNSWKEVSVEELKAFLGLLIAKSIHRVPSMRDCWSTDWVLGVAAFKKKKMAGSSLVTFITIFI